MNGWEQVLDRAPSGLWVALAVANVVVTIAMWSTARRRMRRAGQRTADPDLVTGRARAKDTALTVASMIPAGLFWAMVLAGSLHGLVAFGRDSLGWRDGWEYLVPGTLDGVSVTFAFLAFRAVRKQKAPDRCYRVVWGAAIASATVNFAYEYTHSGHNLIAGGYLALLSLFGMVMFHEFLDQFEEGTAHIKRANPKFGLRWITWPTNTFCAAVAWRNHPPAEDTPATTLQAVANLDRVRTLKCGALEAATMARHERALAKARRHAELTAVTAGRPMPDGPATLPTAVNGHSCGPPPSPPPLPAPSTATASVTDEPLTASGTREDRTGADVKVPATATTLTQWATTWARMCDDGDLARGPLNDDRQARTRYNLSAKQLRNIRNAATSGALRRRADELGVPLPDGYVDRPTAGRVNSTS
jgi:Protein of unknown function (DUF2637)